MFTAFALLAPARAASLDNLEIGGPWGSPTATDGNAVWWNPAGVAAGHGTRLQLEGAPMFASITYERADPHGGIDNLRLSGVVPQLGLASDLGVRGLGVGLALSVPQARGAKEQTAPGPGAYHLMDGMVQSIWGQAALAYDWREKVAVGATAAWVHSSWSATLLSETLPDLDAAIAAQGEESGYTDDLLEDPHYAAILDFPGLSDDTFAFSVGALARPTEQLTIGVAYVSGVRVLNQGAGTVTFDCPPETDKLGRFGSEDYGLCRAVVPVEADIGYTLPARVQAGVAFQVRPDLRVEAMGGWVGWSVFEDYEIRIHDAQAQTEEGAAMVEQERLWARANEDSAWGGLDVKGQLADGRVTLGGRVLYDAAAVPDAALSTNNYDANAVMLSGLLGATPLPWLTVSVSYTHHILATREVDTSAFSVTLDGRDEIADRWFYPHANGTYAGFVNRMGVQARFQLGGREE